MRERKRREIKRENVTQTCLPIQFGCILYAWDLLSNDGNLELLSHNGNLGVTFSWELQSDFLMGTSVTFS